jgi:3-hydroxyacyl-[acyl-carrier-protein] dehydratase
MSKDVTNGFDYLLRIQKNRYPFLFIDKVVSVDPGVSASTLKSFTYNEWFFPIHFEEEPIVPGFIVMEVLIQSFFITFLSLEKYKGANTSDYNIKEFVIKRTLIPGDTLTINALLLKNNKGILEGFAIGMLNGEEVCKIELIVVISEILKEYKGER